MAVIGKVTNKQLIDSNALNERFDKRIKWLRLDMHDQYSLGLYHGAVTDKDLIGEMPTVDAVEVVRCRDCKHRGTDDCIFHIKGEPADEELLRKLDNDFCSYGERKDDDGNG